PARRSSDLAPTTPVRAPQPSFQRWLAPPLQVHRITAVPSAVAAPSTSRHRPDWRPVTVPSGLSSQRWLAPPWHSHRIAAVPSLTPLSSASRHLRVPPE